MSEITKYEAQKKKLDGLCEEHDLTYRVRKDVYPITLTIRPIQGSAEQLSMLTEAEGQDYISPGASMTWIFADGEIATKVEGGTFTIPKTLRSKFENIFLRMISFWQQYFFRYLIENQIIHKYNMPVIDESDKGVDDEPPAELPENVTAFPSDNDIPEDVEPDEDLVTAATLLVRQENKASVALLQRRLKLGYSAASRLMEELEALGVVGPYNGGQPREVLPVDVPEEG